MMGTSLPHWNFAIENSSRCNLEGNRRSMLKFLQVEFVEGTGHLLTLIQLLIPLCLISDEMELKVEWYLI